MSYSFLKKSESENDRKKLSIFNITDIWTFQQLNTLQRIESVKTFPYEYETIEITAASIS